MNPRHRRLTIGFIVALGVILVVLGALAFRGGNDAFGLQIRADTMVPRNMSVRADQLTCPDGPAPSPIEVRDASALADALPLYDGDVIAVRVALVPTGPAADTVRFNASWPDTVVGDGNPLCAFVLGESPNPARVEWLPGESGGTDFAVSGAVPGSTTVVEIWLRADDPEPRTTFRTVVTPEASGDNIIVEPVGGRAQVELRSGAVPDVAVVGTQGDEPGRYSVVATVTNSRPTTRALEVVLRLSAHGDPTWRVDGFDGECQSGVVLECDIGDLDFGDTVEVAASFETQAGWEPRAIACEAPPSDVGFGLCVEAEAGSLSEEVVSAASSIIELPRPTGEPLVIRTDPEEIVGRAGLPINFDFTLESQIDGDLGSIVVVGSDCDAIARTLQPLDDEDAFLEPGEQWRYSCEFEADVDTLFRMNVAATGEGGETVTAEYEGTARVIAPALDVTTARSDGADVSVENSGRGDITNVTVTIPGCESVELIAGEPEVVAEGESVEFACASGSTVLGAIAYGTDQLGFGVVGQLS